ncbi:MAG TPA: molybdenum cofactor guanylyltransferase [Pyrinomonadaceae bacterium]|nr:molybdenum cofactor guanylyltransferase [Pyrinomonadaceae bacterium]
MLDVEGFILVGGRSSRMGTDKSLMQFDGQTSVERIAAELRSITPRISLVGRGRAGFDPDLRIIPDTHEQWGALGGIHAALGACVADWALIVACDLPFVTRDLCSRLLMLSQQGSPEAVVPIQPDGRPQPLCALYRREPCLLEAEKLIASGEHTPRALLANVKTRWVRSAELIDLPGAENFFFNVNTPDDYEQAQLLLLQNPASSG